MWMWLFTALHVVTNVHGFASIPFPQSCASMLPQHERDGVFFEPRKDEPPFETYYELEEEGVITVFLKSKTPDRTFRGFMLEAREQGKADESPPVGRFTLLDSDRTQLLTCADVPGSAVIQKNNHEKSLISAKWRAQGEKRNIIFRATFLETFRIFWAPVDKNVTIPPPPPSTAQPSSTEPSSTEPSSTEPSTTEPSSTEPSTTEPSSTEPGSTVRSTTPTPTASTASTSSPVTVSSVTDLRFSENILAAAMTAMTFDSLGVVLNMELSNILSTVSFSHRLNKGLKITCVVLCAAVEIAALILCCVGDFNKDVLVPLVAVTIVINIIELIIESLPLGPAHDLKSKAAAAVRVCSVIHEVFTIAVLFVGVWEVDNCRKNENESWLVTVMAVYTAWIFLFLIWVFIFNHTKQWRKVNAEKQSWRKKKFYAAANVFSMILIVGTAAFTVAIVYGIFGCQPGT